MAALSDYLESGLLNYVFRGQSFTLPTNISIALTSGVPADSNTGATIPECPSGINGVSTGYSRVSLGDPASAGATAWSYLADDDAQGSGVIKNSGQIVFNTALLDWGWVSGVAIVDDSDYGEGKLLMHSQLSNPRQIYMGDNVKFDYQTLEITFK
ncbi:MAG: hypothetical protein CL833_04195 [Crocinitomicaceae bacterium]|nr:hypothetical protein [Crocinitomicaceae bacterium]|tara:strand:- start:2109 stop:2573 length:465 start_codon:yes stop_codon:yes gene_type:complete